MSAQTPSKEKIKREVYTGPFTESHQKVLGQIAEYYRQKRLYLEGKLTKKPKLPECTQQKYKDMYDEK